MKGWTHFSCWRLWFTFNAAATAWAPSSDILLDPRLQNVRKQRIRSQKYSNVIKWSNINLNECMCCNLPPNYAKTSTLKTSTPPIIAYSAKCMFPVPSAGFPYYFLWKVDLMGVDSVGSWSIGSWFSGSWFRESWSHGRTCHSTCGQVPTKWESVFKLTWRKREFVQPVPLNAFLQQSQQQQCACHSTGSPNHFLPVLL